MARWPFAGRRQELSSLSRLAQDTASQGLVIAGPAGVGKSRLAAEVLCGFSPSVFTVASIRATRAASGIPYGALAHLLPARLPGAHATNPLRWAADAVASRGPRIVLAVDDAHLLDAASAAVVHHLVGTGRSRIVATLRVADPAPDSVLALWKDGLAVRVDIGPLTVEDTLDVLTTALGGPVDDAAIRRLWRATEGNALLLYETVAAAVESGTLTEVRGMWQMNRDAPVTPRLMDLIHDRVGALPDDVNAVLEFTALAEPLGLNELVALCEEQAVDQAEERGLIRIAPEDGRTTVRLGHPIYGEIARSRCPRLRRRHRFAELTRIVEETGARRREDVLRLTVWRLESGRQTEAEPLLAACKMAWAAHDYPLAIRLGRGAVEAGGGADAAILLGTVLDYAQLPEEAAAVLAEAERTLAKQQAKQQAKQHDGAERTRARLVLAQASNLAWGMNRLDDALRLLDVTEAGRQARPLLQEIAVRRLNLIASAARPREAIQLSEALLRESLAPESRAQIRNARALALCHSGRTQEAAHEVQEVLAEAAQWHDAAPATVSPLHSTWSLSGLFAGDLAMMERAIGSMEQAAAAEYGWSRGEGSLALAKGHLAMMRGAPADALRALHAAAHHETALTVGGCMGAYAAALAMRGDAQAAQLALDEAVRRNRPTWTAFTSWVSLTRVAIAAASGAIGMAVELAVAAAIETRKSGLPGFEFLALHDVVRLGAADRAVARLAVLAEEHDGDRVALTYRHALAATAVDGEGLLVVADGFDGLGMTLLAAEAMAQAAAAFRRAGDERRAGAAERHAWRLAERCQGARTPALRGLAAPQLTPRQREIVQLAAAGLSNREIAQRLVLSKRTVDNHMVAAYDRLGVRDRAELVRLVAKW